MKNLIGGISFVTCIALAACGASSGSPPLSGASLPNAHAVLHPPSSGSTIVATTDPANNDVVICNPSCSDCKTVGGGLNAPMGNAVGPYHGKDLGHPARDYGFVADTNDSRVVVYTDTCSTVAILNDSVTLSTGPPTAYFPESVAVAPNGTVAVTNACSAPSCSGPGNIVFFARGSTKITSVATGVMSSYLFGAFDKHGNFYNDGLTSLGKTVVGVVKRGSTIDSAVKISNLGTPGGIQIARNGTINIDDPTCTCIHIYKGSKQIGSVTLSNALEPVTFAFTQTESDVWVADKETKEVMEFSYPLGGSSIDVLGGFSQPFGVAVWPPDRP